MLCFDGVRAGDRALAVLGQRRGFARTLYAAGLCVLAGLSLGAASPSISPAVANLYIGENKVIEGTITASQRDGNAVRLTLGTMPHNMTVALVIGMLSHFPEDPEHYYLGKEVRVSGLIQSFRGVPEVVIHDPADIELASATTGTASRPVAAPVPAATPLGAVPRAAARRAAVPPAVVPPAVEEPVVEAPVAVQPAAAAPTAVPPAAMPPASHSRTSVPAAEPDLEDNDRPSAIEKRLEEIGARLDALDRRLRQLEHPAQRRASHRKKRQ